MRRGVSIAKLTRSTSPASTPSATESDAPSSASIVFSATIGSLSGRPSVPNAASSAKRVNLSVAGNADNSGRKRPSTKTMRGASIRGKRASKVLSSPTRLIGSWNAASATGRRLVYFQASSRRPDGTAWQPRLAECLCCRQPQPRVAGQARAQPFEASEEAGGAGLNGSGHVIASSPPVMVGEGRPSTSSSCRYATST